MSKENFGFNHRPRKQAQILAEEAKYNQLWLHVHAAFRRCERGNMWENGSGKRTGKEILLFCAE